MKKKELLGVYVYDVGRAIDMFTYTDFYRNNKYNRVKISNSFKKIKDKYNYLLSIGVINMVLVNSPKKVMLLSTDTIARINTTEKSNINISIVNQAIFVGEKRFKPHTIESEPLLELESDSTVKTVKDNITVNPEKLTFIVDDIKLEYLTESKTLKFNNSTYRFNMEELDQKIKETEAIVKLLKLIKKKNNDFSFKL
jgi:hypothetical protein